MAKFRPVYTSLWRDPDFQELTPEDSYLFIYLCTNQAVTESGIYPLSLKVAANETKLSLEMIKQALTANRIKNVLFDQVNSFVFVKNIFKYHIGGRPDLLAKSIESEYKITHHCPLWKTFFEVYPSFIYMDSCSYSYIERSPNVRPTLGQRSPNVPPTLAIEAIISKERDYVEVDNGAGLGFDVERDLFIRAYKEGYVKERTEAEFEEAGCRYFFPGVIPDYITPALDEAAVLSLNITGLGSTRTGTN